MMREGYGKLKEEEVQ